MRNVFFYIFTRRSSPSFFHPLCTFFFFPIFYKSSELNLRAFPSDGTVLCTEFSSM